MMNARAQMIAKRQLWRRCTSRAGERTVWNACAAGRRLIRDECAAAGLAIGGRGYCQSIPETGHATSGEAARRQERGRERGISCKRGPADLVLPQDPFGPSLLPPKACYLAYLATRTIQRVRVCLGLELLLRLCLAWMQRCSNAAMQPNMRGRVMCDCHTAPLCGCAGGRGGTKRQRGKRCRRISR